MIYVLYVMYDLLKPWYQRPHSCRCSLVLWRCVNICHFGRENGGDSAIWRILPLALLLLCRLVILWVILSNFCLMFLARKGKNKKGLEIWQSLAECPAKYRHGFSLQDTWASAGMPRFRIASVPGPRLTTTKFKCQKQQLSSTARF